MNSQLALKNTTLASDNAKEKEHPQRDLMKTVCDGLFYLGGGNFWYEERNLSKVQQILYNIYAVTINFYIFGNCINQHLAHFLDLTPKERTDAVQFSIGHTHLCAKFVTSYLARNRVKVFLKRLLEENREFAVLEIDLSSVKRAKRYAMAMIMSLAFCLCTGLAAGIMIHIKQGVPIRTEIVMYPTPTDSGLMVNILRTLIEVHWWAILALMAAVDVLSCLSLVFLGYKYRTLGAYFVGLRQKYLQRSGEDLDILEKDFNKDFIAGIKFHKNTLWCQRNLQSSLGNMYSIQITASLMLVTYTLIKLVTSERSSANLIASLTYLTALTMITGAYMMAGGDIIVESEKIPMTIFHSGWELTRASRCLRSLVVITLIQSQVPVFMTAFGIIILSYDNFILILKNSYSFFAVMY